MLNIQKVLLTHNNIVIKYKDGNIKNKFDIDLKNKNEYEFYKLMLKDDFFGKNIILPNYEIYNIVNKNKKLFNIINNSLSIEFLLSIYKGDNVFEYFNFIKNKIVLNYIKIKNINLVEIKLLLNLLDIEEKVFFENIYFKNNKLNYSNKDFSKIKDRQKIKNTFNIKNEFDNNNLIFFAKNEEIIEGFISINKFNDFLNNVGIKNIFIDVEKIDILELSNIFKYLEIEKELTNLKYIINNIEKKEIEKERNFFNYPLIFSKKFNIYIEKMNNIKYFIFNFDNSEENIQTLEYINNLLKNEYNNLTILNKNNYLDDNNLYLNDYYDITYFLKIKE
jgi:hypothetical protein